MWGSRYVELVNWLEINLYRWSSELRRGWAWNWWWLSNINQIKLRNSIQKRCLEFKVNEIDEMQKKTKWL